MESKILNRELALIAKEEEKLAGAAARAKPAAWKTQLESRIPEKVYTGLESAFCKGFEVVFSQGRGLIEKSYNKEEILKDHAIRDYAVQLKGGKKELRTMRKSAGRSDLRNLLVTTAGGVGLGALGIGMPDIVLFVGTVLKGVYETALNYGFDYTSAREQLLILKMLAASLSTGDTWVSLNREVDELLPVDECAITEEELHSQMKETASVFALDMLLLKFVQGVPVVGILGGLSNPVYYRRILRYVQLKYRRRYFMKISDGKREP